VKIIFFVRERREKRKRKKKKNKKSQNTRKGGFVPLHPTIPLSFC
jgi:hypothetical protein